MVRIVVVYEAESAEWIMSEGIDGSLHFFLGGADLEMNTIAELLRSEGVPFDDLGLGWGARLSHYGERVEQVAAAGARPVVVELELDRPLPEGALVVDHHGEAAGAKRPSSLRQVFDLLGLPEARWSRRLALVAANDTGHVAAMAALGASVAEMAAIRAADRHAQGVDEAEESAVAAALESRTLRFDGRLTEVELPNDRSGVAADLLDPRLGGAGFRNLLCWCPGELAFYGDGAVVEGLAEAFDGWWGGALPTRGFWGCSRTEGGVGADRLYRVIESRLSPP